jgi:hypothetical protein
MNNLKMLPVLLVFLGVAMRLLPHPANFAPVTAIALFGGMYLPRKYAFILPIAAVFLSDLWLGFDFGSMWAVYGSFLLSGLIGLYIRKHKCVSTVVLGSVTASVAFFLITNFAVWIGTSMYSKDIAGFINCYVAAIPFYRNTLMGDLFFTGLFVGGYELVQYFLKDFYPKMLSGQDK